MAKLVAAVAEGKQTEERLSEQLAKFKHKAKGARLTNVMMKMKIPKLPIGAAKTESVEDGLRQEVDSLKQVIEELTVDFQDVSTSLENEENDKVRLEATLTEAREKFARLDSEKDRLEEQLSELNAGMAYQADLTRGESLNELDNVEADLKMVKKKLAKKDAEPKLLAAFRRPSARARRRCCPGLRRMSQ